MGKLILKGGHYMIEVTKAAIDRLEKAIKAEGKNIQDNFIRLYMAAG